MRHIISIKDFDKEKIEALLDRAGAIDAGTYDRHALDDRILGVLFFEPSTRTRMSFEAAMARLGGTSIDMGGVEASSVVKGETLADTIRVVSGYADAIVLRHPKEGAARLAAEFSSVPVLNAGDGAGQHPSQTLIDLYTIRQAMPLDRIDVGLLGDLRYGRTAHSLAYALTEFNVTIHTLAPQSLEMPPNVMEGLKDRGVEVVRHDDIEEFTAGLDVMYVTRIQRERFPDTASYYAVASSYRVTPELLERAREQMIVLHPLPRVDEIDPGVDALPHARYFEQARNGIPIRMALLLEVMG
jgi:aspartate carbamoyltransferase catalytic subunit